MLINDLTPPNTETLEDLVVYGGTGKAARSWEASESPWCARCGRSATTRRCSCSPASRSA